MLNASANNIIYHIPNKCQENETVFLNMLKRYILTDVFDYQIWQKYVVNLEFRAIPETSFDIAKNITDSETAPKKFVYQ